MSNVVASDNYTPAARAIDGVKPVNTAAPESIEELQEILVDSSDLGIVVTGNGTKLDFGGTPTRYDLQIDLSQLPRSIHHSPGDLVVRASANIPMAGLADVLHHAGQRLSVDEVIPNSTIGGVVATAISGPLRYRFGAVRDLLLGVTYVRADGVAAKAGGSVVKNVAGYDLSKLLCGSFGTLAVITECIFRLHPLPERRRVLSATLPPAAAAAAALAIADDAQDATSIEVNIEHHDHAELAVVIEGSSAGSERRTQRLMGHLGSLGEVTDQVPSWWGTLPGPVVLKVAFASSNGAKVWSEIWDCVGEGATIRGSLALGTLNVGLRPETTNIELAQVMKNMRSRLLSYDGTVQVLRASGEQKLGVDLFGPVAGLDLMERVKRQFDPKLVLGPGRFVGGW